MSDLPYPITLAEALTRLAGNDMIETRFETRPNDGVTVMNSFPREDILALLLTAPPGYIAESGVEAQRLGFGIYVPFESKWGGFGLLFIQTAPVARVSREEILAKEDQKLREHFGDGDE